MLRVTEAPSDQQVELGDDSPVKLFGDPRASHVTRGPERRASKVIEGAHAETHLEIIRGDGDHHPSVIPRSPGPGRALRLGRGDGFATSLNALGVLVLSGSIIAGCVILYNAKNVGAFSDPWNSDRVAIGLAVLGVGISLGALLLGVARAITYQLATLRLKMHELDHAAATHPPAL